MDLKGPTVSSVIAEIRPSRKSKRRTDKDQPTNEVTYTRHVHATKKDSKMVSTDTKMVSADSKMVSANFTGLLQQFYFTSSRNSFFTKVKEI